MKAWLTVVSMLLGAGLLAQCAPGARLAADAPVEVVTAWLKPGDVPEAARHESVVGFWRVHLHEDVLSAEALTEGRVLSIRLPEQPGQEAQSVVATVYAAEPVGAYTNVRARGEDGATVLLTVGREGVSGRVQTARPAQRFDLRYDAPSRRHVLLRIDPEREDVLPGAPPLEPPPEHP